MIRVGPAGWSYPDSPGHVYPADVPSRFDALAFTASYFDTIEINSTFYRPQPPKTCAAWVRRVAHNPDFRFTAKLWRRFTHEPDPWTAEDVRVATEGLEVLRTEGRFGALLVQFPWSFKPGRESTERLARLAGDLAGWPLVVEVRHGAWAHREHALRLRELGLGFCNIDQPLIGDSLGPTAGVTGPVGYVRFHGRNDDQWFAEHEDSAQRYNYLYGAAELEPWVERIRKVARGEGVTDVYVVSNNHFEGKGPANALMIRAMLEGRKVTAPPVLFATYRAVLEPWAEPGAPPRTGAAGPVPSL
jgi:uncharacterized protein YecE (DUF72 family)